MGFGIKKVVNNPFRSLRKKGGPLPTKENSTTSSQSPALASIDVGHDFGFDVDAIAFSIDSTSSTSTPTPSSTLRSTIPSVTGSSHTPVEHVSKSTIASAEVSKPFSVSTDAPQDVPPSSSLTVLSTKLVPEEMAAVMKQVCQGLDTLQRDVGELRREKAERDLVYAKEIESLHSKVAFLEMQSSVLRDMVTKPRRKDLRHVKSETQLLLFYMAQGSFQGLQSVYPSHTPFTLLSSESIGPISSYDPSSRCGLSADKLLASAPPTIDSCETIPEIMGEGSSSFCDLWRSRPGSSISFNDQPTIISNSLINSIPFPSASDSPPLPSGPVFRLPMQMYAADDKESDTEGRDIDPLPEVPEKRPAMKACWRMSIVDLVQKKYQTGEDQASRRAISFPVILPSQFGMAALERPSSPSVETPIPDIVTSHIPDEEVDVDGDSLALPTPESDVFGSLALHTSASYDDDDTYDHTDADLTSMSFLSILNEPPPQNTFYTLLNATSFPSPEVSPVVDGGHFFSPTTSHRLSKKTTKSSTGQPDMLYEQHATSHTTSNYTLTLPYDFSANSSATSFSSPTRRFSRQPNDTNYTSMLLHDPATKSIAPSASLQVPTCHPRMSSSQSGHLNNAFSSNNASLLSIPPTLHTIKITAPSTSTDSVLLQHDFIPGSLRPRILTGSSSYSATSSVAASAPGDTTNVDAETGSKVDECAGTIDTHGGALSASPLSDATKIHINLNGHPSESNHAIPLYPPYPSHTKEQYPTIPHNLGTRSATNRISSARTRYYNHETDVAASCSLPSASGCSSPASPRIGRFRERSFVPPPSYSGYHQNKGKQRLFDEDEGYESRRMSRAGAGAGEKENIVVQASGGIKADYHAPSVDIDMPVVGVELAKWERRARQTSETLS